MFTGLVERIGSILEIEEQDNARQFVIAVGDDDYLRDASLGESICVEGVCLTVIDFTAKSFRVQVVEETLRRSTLGKLRVGSDVNLERALRADARLGGHIVQGHVDGTGVIYSMRDEGESTWVTIEPPFEMMKYIVEKGSICVDGISLTVANVAYQRFSVAIIPHTQEVTTAGEWKEGRGVNLETDILAKHVARLLEWDRQSLPMALEVGRDGGDF